jgi:hypothetical protein
MNQNITIVSALFNIDREKMDGRKWEEYLEWFDITLKLKIPMVLFVTEDIREFVEERRAQIPTSIIVQTVDDIPYYYLKPQIDVIIEDPDHKNRVDDPERIECQHSIYSIIQYSKFKWMKQAAYENLFGSDYFFWLDSGASRFFEGLDLNNQFPGPGGLEAIENMGENFLLQLNVDHYKDIAYANTLPDEYLRDSRAITCGSFFGGHKNIIDTVANMVDQVWTEKIIGENFINNEQIVLAYLLKNESDLFTEYRRDGGHHMQLFTELSR